MLLFIGKIPWACKSGCNIYPTTLCVPSLVLSLCDDSIVNLYKQHNIKQGSVHLFTGESLAVAKRCIVETQIFVLLNIFSIQFKAYLYILCTLFRLCALWSRMGQSCDLYIFMCIVTVKFHYHQLSIMNPNYFLFREQFWLCSPAPRTPRGRGRWFCLVCSMIPGMAALVIKGRSWEADNYLPDCQRRWGSV